MTGGRFDETEPVPATGPEIGVPGAVSREASIAGGASCVGLGLGDVEVGSCGPLHAAAHVLKTKAAVRSNARSMLKSLLLASVPAGGHPIRKRSASPLAANRRSRVVFPPSPAGEGRVVGRGANPPRSVCYFFACGMQLPARTMSGSQVVVNNARAS